MRQRHDEAASLGGYVLAALDPLEARAVEGHLAGCPRCRAELAQLRNAHAVLGGVPPEALLEGPPADDDLLLRRTLRSVRAERDALGRRKFVRTGLAAAAVAAVLAGGGVFVGWVAAPDAGAGGQIAEGAGAAATTASATDTGTGAAMRVSMEPVSDWVRLTATVEGVAEGLKCRLVVVSADGAREVAGSWAVSAKGEREGLELQGAAAIPAPDVAAVQVETFDGRRLVSVPLTG